MSNVIDLDSFVSYIRSRLGEPVVRVELEDTQIESIVYDTIDTFQRYSYGEGNYEDYMVTTLTSGTNEYNLSGCNILSTIDFRLSTSEGGSINMLFSPLNFVAADFLAGGGLTQFGLINYHTAMLMLQEIQNVFAVQFRVDFRPGSQIMRVTPTPDQDYVGLLLVYRKETAANLYNNIQVKKLALAKTKILWGEILNKHTITLPGGSTLNGADIITRGREEEEKTMEEIRSESEPPGFFVG